MQPPKNAIILKNSDVSAKIGKWILWKDISGLTDWSHTYMHSETSAAFAVLYSAEHGAYAMYLGVEDGREHPAPEVIRKLGIGFLIEGVTARPGSWEY